MKKLICLWFSLMLVVFCCFQALAESSLDDVFDEPSEEEPEEETVEEPIQEEQVGGEGPAVRWTYAISMAALYTDESKLVNRENLLDETFEPQDLVKMSVKRATSAQVFMREIAATALEGMFDAAKEAGYTLFLKSGYRSYGTQKTTYSNRLESNGGKDDGVVAYPGASEHQTGLACDILNGDYAKRPRMTTDFSETAEAQWMKENCTKFGFILRYPDGAMDITGIIFEPWHFRYVGKEVAGYLTRNEMTLEEFTDEWQLAVAEFQGRGGDIDAQIEYEEVRKSAGPEPYNMNVFGDDGDMEISLPFY